MSKQMNETRQASLIAELINIARSFLDGAITPSRTGFFGMLSGIVVMLSVVHWYFDYSTLAGQEGAYLARSSADSDGAATYRALQIGRGIGTDPLLVILGSSITASAFASEQILETELKQMTGMSWKVAILTTALQSPIDQITLIQTALGTQPQKRKHIVFLLGVDITHTGWSTKQILDVDKEPRLGIRSDWADEEITRLGGKVRPRSGSFILENPRFFTVNGAKTILRLMARRAAERRFDLFSPAKFLPAGDRKRTLIAKQIRTSLAPADPGVLPIFRRLDNRLKKLGSGNLILMQEYPSPALLQQENLADAVTNENAIYRKFANEIGAGYWPFFREVSLTANDYFDDLHIGNLDAQAKFRSALANKIKDMFGEME